MNFGVAFSSYFGVGHPTLAGLFFAPHNPKESFEESFGDFSRSVLRRCSGDCFSAHFPGTPSQEATSTAWTLHLECANVWGQIAGGHSNTPPQVASLCSAGRKKCERALECMPCGHFVRYRSSQNYYPQKHCLF